MKLRIKSALAARHPIDLNADHRYTIFVAGTGRSGTTWLANILNFRNEFRYIFEPFDAGRVELWIGLSSIQYLQPDEIDNRYLHAATAIVSGRYRSRWTDAFNRRIISRRRLVKAIRANLLLRWLHANFPGIPIILLLRHPCAVVNSWLHLDWPPSIEETFLEQPRLVEDYLHPYLGLIKGAKTFFPS